MRSAPFLSVSHLTAMSQLTPRVSKSRRRTPNSTADLQRPPIFGDSISDVLPADEKPRNQVSADEKARNEEDVFLSTMMEDQTRSLDGSGRKLCAKHRHHFQRRLNDSVTATGNSFYQQSQQRQHIKSENQNPSADAFPLSGNGTRVRNSSLHREHHLPVISSVPFTLITNTSTNSVRTSPVPTFSSSSTSTTSNFALTFTKNPFLFDVPPESEAKKDDPDTPGFAIHANVIELDTTIDVIPNPSPSPKR